MNNLGVHREGSSLEVLATMVVCYRGSVAISAQEADYVPRKLFTANHKSMFEKHTKVNAKIDAALEKIDKRVKYLEEVVAAQKRAMLLEEEDRSVGDCGQVETNKYKTRKGLKGKQNALKNKGQW